MSTPDMDVIKDIPGYKVILKAILKSQIHQLVEQLAANTDEESVLLTASVSDGTLSHLGSDSGKFFLEDHDDIKSQFLGFCLKRHHKKKQQEKEKEEAMRAMPPSPSRFGPRPGYMPSRSPRFSSPRHVRPVAMTRAAPGGPLRSPGGIRHSPYPMHRPPRRPLNYDQQPTGMRMPIGNRIDNQVIKIEAEDTDENSNQSANNDSSVQQTERPDVQASVSDTSPSSPSQPSTSAPTASQIKSETSGDKDDDAKSESSSSTIPNEASDMKFPDSAPPEGLSLDSDLSNLISSESATQSSETAPNISQAQSGSAEETPGSSEVDPNVNVKLEAISEADMELEITGVELGQPRNIDPSMGGAMDPSVMALQDNWGAGGATGSAGDMQGSQQGYSAVEGGDTPSSFSQPGSMQSQSAMSNLIRNMHAVRQFQSDQHVAGQPGDASVVDYTALSRFSCGFCGRCFSSRSALDMHENIHTGLKPFICDLCGISFSHKSNMQRHVKRKHSGGDPQLY